MSFNICNKPIGTTIPVKKSFYILHSRQFDWSQISSIWAFLELQILGILGCHWVFRGAIEYFGVPLSILGCHWVSKINHVGSIQKWRYKIWGGFEGWKGVRKSPIVMTSFMNYPWSLPGTRKLLHLSLARIWFAGPNRKCPLCAKSRISSLKCKWWSHSSKCASHAAEPKISKCKQRWKMQVSIANKLSFPGIESVQLKICFSHSVCCKCTPSQIMSYQSSVHLHKIVKYVCFLN